MHRIKRMKEKLIEEAQSRMQSMDGGSIEQMGQIIDMIKDLSEAEKSCLEAEYYDSVIDAMDGGYDRRGYQESYYPDRDGYRNSQGQYAKRPSRRRMRRSGYTEESVENIRQMMEEADPERRKQLKRDLQDLMQEI